MVTNCIILTNSKNLLALALEMYPQMVAAVARLNDALIAISPILPTLLLLPTPFHPITFPSLFVLIALQLPPKTHLHVQYRIITPHHEY